MKQTLFALPLPPIRPIPVAVPVPSLALSRKASAVWWQAGSVLLLAGLLTVLANTAQSTPPASAVGDADDARQLQWMLMLHQNGSAPLMLRGPSAFAGLSESSALHSAYGLSDRAGASAASEVAKQLETQR